MKKNTFYFLLLLLLLVGCKKDTSFTSTEEPSNAKNLIEVPALGSDKNDLFINHSTTIDGKKVTTYSLEYDRKQRHAKWVAFSFDSTTAKKGSGRTDQWGDDPAIPSNEHSNRSDFRGYDRGHICASYDRQYSEEANIQTFYYSNMSPQLGDFNRKIWVHLEQKVQNWGRSSVFRNELYVVKGGTIKADQVLGYNGYHNIPVPRYYWMTLVCEKNGYYKGIAFWLEHKSYGNGPYNFETFAISIDELEERTGFDFFHNLPDNIENSIEATYDYSKW